MTNIELKKELIKKIQSDMRVRSAVDMKNKDNIFTISHPASASYGNTVWDTKKTFTKITPMSLM